jgi:dolichol kinase
MEVKRQMIHLSGLFFVILAQFTDKYLAAIYFFMIAITFFIYSEHVRRERRRLAGFLDSMEKRIRGLATRFERQGIARPFLGAFWFYMGCGISFLLFPLHIASAACAMLAVGDAFSTLVGNKFGRHRTVGNKTLEGSLAFFVVSLLIALIFVDPKLALLGSLAATITELVPEIGGLKPIKDKGYLDDNLLIPIIAGFVMILLELLI